MAMELVKENIECEQLLDEKSCDNSMQEEHVIPDTHPDVNEILLIDAKPIIVNKEVTQDKVSLEGQVEYTMLYLAKEEENTGIHSVTYVDNFSNDINIPGAEHNMPCDINCYVENVVCEVVNERKIRIRAVIKSKAEIYKSYDFEVIKDISGSEDIQLLKDSATVDKIIGTVTTDLEARSQIQVSMDKPQIGNILKCDVNVHRKDVRVMEGKVFVEASALVTILYRGKDIRDIVCLEDTIHISKEVEAEGVNPTMSNYTDFRVESVEVDLKEDDLGESRIVSLGALIKSNTKVMYKEAMDIVEDAYSPSSVMEMTRQNYELNVMYGHASNQNIVKYNIEFDDNDPKVSQVIMCYGKACIINKKLVEDKVVVEGVINADVLYKTSDENKYLCTVSEEIPFNCSIDIPGCKIDMQCIAKVSLESIDASIEADTIAIKAVVDIYSRVNYITHKEFLVDMNAIEGELPEKKASLTIYAVQQGDTLWKIAKKYATTIDNLIKLNNIEDPDIVKLGDKLIIPGRAII